MQGLVIVFQIINKPERVLVVAVSDSETNLDEVVEGAKSAVVSHRMLAVIPAHPKENTHIETVSGIRRLCVQAVECTRAQGNESVVNRIPAMGRKRQPSFLTT